MYTPDKWVVLKIRNDSEILFKVLAGWSGGYTYGDSWRINSGIVKVVDDGDYVLFHGESGSVYKCHKDSYGLSMATAGIYNQMKQIYSDDIEMLPSHISWLHLV